MCSFDNILQEIFTDVYFWNKLHMEVFEVRKKFEVPHVVLLIFHCRDRSLEKEFKRLPASKTYKNFNVISII